MRIFENFQLSPDDQVYVCGVIVKKNKNHRKILLVNNGKKFKPCGRTLRFNDDRFSDHDSYMKSLEQLLKSSIDPRDKKIFDHAHIEKILEHESFYDKERGSVALYFRSVIFSFIEKIGIYPAQLHFVAHTEKKNTALATYMFHVRIAWSPIDNGLFHYIDQSSQEDVYGKYSLGSHYLGILNYHDIQVYQGSSKQYKVLYKILNKTF